MNYMTSCHILWQSRSSHGVPFKFLFFNLTVITPELSAQHRAWSFYSRPNPQFFLGVATRATSSSIGKIPHHGLSNSVNTPSSCGHPVYRPCYIIWSALCVPFLAHVLHINIRDQQNIYKVFETRQNLKMR